MNTKPVPVSSIIDTIDIETNPKTTNSSISNNNKLDNNSPYALREDYRPPNNKAYIAVDIAKQLNDTKAFARHLKIVELIGPFEAYRLFRETLDTIRLARNNNKPIKNPGALYNSKVVSFLKKNNFL